jgi:hypothetical protein
MSEPYIIEKKLWLKKSVIVSILVIIFASYLSIQITVKQLEKQQAEQEKYKQDLENPHEDNPIAHLWKR